MTELKISTAFNMGQFVKYQCLGYILDRGEVVGILPILRKDKPMLIRYVVEGKIGNEKQIFEVYEDELVAAQTKSLGAVK